MFFYAADVPDSKQLFHGFAVTYSSRLECKHISSSCTCYEWTVHLLAWICVSACLVCPHVIISELMPGFLLDFILSFTEIFLDAFKFQLK